MPDYALGPHTASLGLAFVRSDALGATYANGAFVGQHGETLSIRQQVANELDALSGNLDAARGCRRYVTAGAREARHKAGADRVSRD